MRRGGQESPDFIDHAFISDICNHLIIYTGRSTIHIFKTGLDQSVSFIQIDAVSKDLQESLQTAYDIVEAVLIKLGHIAGMEASASFISQSQVFSLLGIAQSYPFASIISKRPPGMAKPILPNFSIL